MKYTASILVCLLTTLCQIVYGQEEFEKQVGELNDQYDSLAVHGLGPGDVEFEEFVTAVDAWIAWTNLVATLGVEDELSEEFDFYHEKIETTLPQLTERLFYRCVHNHDISQIENLLHLYQLSTQFADHEASTDIEEKLQTCGQFRLEFFSELRLIDGWLTTMEAQVEFEVSHETAGFGSYRVLGSAEVNISGNINYNDESATITSLGFVDGVLKVTDFRWNDGNVELDWLLDPVPQEHLEFLYIGPPSQKMEQHTTDHWAVLFDSRCNVALEENTEIPADLSVALEGLAALNEGLEASLAAGDLLGALAEMSVFPDLIAPVDDIVENFEPVSSPQFDPEDCDQNNVARVDGYFSGYIERDWQQGEGNLIAYKEINHNNEKTVMKIYH
mgnify:CR=1 FL=1|tara:strand:- start:1470 stop:2633 length:1164 start_codon:yes stop_codon:yes gene_type:complete